MICRGALAVAAVAVLILAPSASAAPDQPLAGKTIVVDPGHQLGNSNPRFAKQLAQTIFNGRITKACNTTGTATNAGLPEATFTWQVGKRLKSGRKSVRTCARALAKAAATQ